MVFSSVRYGLGLESLNNFNNSLISFFDGLMSVSSFAGYSFSCSLFIADLRMSMNFLLFSVQDPEVNSAVLRKFIS